MSSHLEFYKYVDRLIKELPVQPRSNDEYRLLFEAIMIQIQNVLAEVAVDCLPIEGVAELNQELDRGGDGLAIIHQYLKNSPAFHRAVQQALH